MRIPSRRMPADPRMGPFAAAASLVVLMALLALPGLARWELAFVGPGLFAAVNLRELVRARRMRDARRGESICTFARAFDLRSIDARIVRATYEELSTDLGYPVRPDDRLDQGFEPEDVDTLMEDIAARAGRGSNDTTRNPLRGKVQTLRDLVHFVNHQPPA